LNDPGPDIQLIWFSFYIDRTPAFILGSGGIVFEQADLFLSKIFENLHGLHINISVDEVKPIIFYHGNSACEGNQTI
jgi:hypothetical protein